MDLQGKLKRILTKVKVTELSIIPHDSKKTVVNQKPLLLMKAKEINKDGVEDMNTQDQVPVEKTSEQVAQEKQAEIGKINEGKLKELENIEGINNRQDEIMDNRISNIEAHQVKIQAMIDNANNTTPPVQPQHPAPQVPEAPTREMPTLPLQTQQAAENAGIQTPPATPDPAQSQTVQPTNIDPAPKVTIPPKKSVDVFNANQQANKDKQVRDIHQKYANDATLNPFDMLEEVARL